MTDLPINQVLAAAGFDLPSAARRAHEVIIAAGLTRPGKERIALDKLERISAATGEVLIGACADPDCQRIAGYRGMEMVTVTSGSCTICGGGANRRAVARLVETCARHKIRRILIIGGSPNARGEVGRLASDTGLDIRCVDAIGRIVRRRDADHDMAWAQVMVIWAPTPLPHKVSDLYLRSPAGLISVVCPRRGIAAVAQEIISRLS